MNDPVVKIKDLLFTIIFSVTLIICLFFKSFIGKNTKIVFCNVGQGDATYIRVKNNFDILIDFGPDRSVLNCLGKYLPFYDKKIELAILTHTDSDHYGGLINVLNHYKIKNIIINNSDKNISFIKAKNQLNINRVKIESLFANQSIIIDKNSSLDFYWPPKNYKTTNDNDLSYIFVFEENDFRAMFCGDASKQILDRLSHQPIKSVDLLLVPHHGSKNGLTKNFLDLAKPSKVVISVAKNNSYGHPSTTILDLLKARNIKIKRTDLNGDIFYQL